MVLIIRLNAGSSQTSYDSMLIAIYKRIRMMLKGENKETQAAIEKVIHMSSDMFKHIVALNTYSEPFLALKNNEQRDIIEQLLGITLLSEKAEVIKSMLKDTKMVYNRKNSM
jgi:DNA repair exonuclease SbcCD ATPase subunit